MRLLLASAGITNASIRAALVDLLGKPISDSTALCIPTASYGMRSGGAVAAWQPPTGGSDATLSLVDFARSTTRRRSR